MSVSSVINNISDEVHKFLLNLSEIYGLLFTHYGDYAWRGEYLALDNTWRNILIRQVQGDLLLFSVRDIRCKELCSRLYKISNLSKVKGVHSFLDRDMQGTFRSYS